MSYPKFAVQDYQSWYKLSSIHVCDFGLCISTKVQLAIETKCDRPWFLVVKNKPQINFSSDCSGFSFMDNVFLKFTCPLEVPLITTFSVNYIFCSTDSNVVVRTLHYLECFVSLNRPLPQPVSELTGLFDLFTASIVICHVCCCLCKENPVA